MYSAGICKIGPESKDRLVHGGALHAANDWPFGASAENPEMRDASPAARRTRCISTQSISLHNCHNVPSLFVHVLRLNRTVHLGDCQLALQKDGTIHILSAGQLWYPKDIGHVLEYSPLERGSLDR